MFDVTIISLFPEAFPGPLGLSSCGRGLGSGVWTLEMVDLRAFGEGSRRNIDDSPAGGGPGMVMRADIVAKALDSVQLKGRPRLFLSPRGHRLDQSKARELAQGPGLILLCGRFEGLDQRVIEARQLEEISIGDFVLAGGETAAMALTEACVRLLPGLTGNPSSTTEESFEHGLLEYPHYTRPLVFEGETIPEILRSGDHGAVKHWRQEQAKTLTQQRRPDLYSAPADKNAGEQDCSRTIPVKARK